MISPDSGGSHRRAYRGHWLNRIILTHRRKGNRNSLSLSDCFKASLQAVLDVKTVVNSVRQSVQIVFGYALISNSFSELLQPVSD